ncbi:MAG: helix-turn-helix domain-containing protein [Calditrichia bacterium]
MGKEFGAYLRKLRDDLGMSLRQVQQAAKISNSYLSQIESGERGIPNFKILSRLAEAYGVPVAQLAEAAEKAEAGDALGEPSLSKDAAFVSRGYEKLSDDNKKMLSEFLQHLINKEKKE